VSQNLPLVIVGGNSLVAPWLMERLRAAGRGCDVISRNEVLKAIVALGSTSLFSKASSANSVERITAAQLETAEKTFQDWCLRSNVHGTLLRPTMIYDCVRDANVTRLAHFVKRFRFLPLAAPAQGLRQPIHADDVAGAIFKCIGNEAIYDKVLNIAGGEVLTYRAMAERIFAALDIKLRLLMLPQGWLEKGFHWASQIGVLRETAFGSAIFSRMNQDLIFDVAEGLRLLNYQPRTFKPEFKDQS
jgi:nucleoside-diphosphate-sugar epimerase